MWFCCYSFGSQLYAWKNFDCSSLSQWQIPSRLLDRASSFSSFSHSLILPKMLFNTLSLPFSCFDYCFDDGSRGISNPAPSSTRFHCWKIRDVFPQLLHWTLFCAVLSSHPAYVSSASYQSNQFRSKLVTWTQRLFLQSQFWKPEPQHTWSTAARLDSSCAFPAFQIVIADFHLSIVW